MSGKKLFFGILSVAVIAVLLCVSIFAFSRSPEKTEEEETEEEKEPFEEEETFEEPVKEETPSDAEKKPPAFSGFKMEEDGLRYYLEGVPVKDQFLFIDGDLYRFDGEGLPVTGWYYSETMDRLYYFTEAGTAEEGWIYDDEKWYYLEDNALVKGWKEILSDDESFWFCFDEEGVLYTDTVTPDGYSVDENGARIEGKASPVYDSSFEWSREPAEDPGPLSGLSIAGYPVEFYMLCIAGETSGLANLSAVSKGDGGRAYGICQLDYRYDLVPFMRFAYEKHPSLWAGFASYLNYSPGNAILRYNQTIGDTFLEAMQVDYETAVSDQLEFMSDVYFSDMRTRLNAAGFDLDNRHIAVSAALFSVSVNCGSQPSVFINNLSPDMTDEEMIRGIYNLRNTVFANQKVGTALKGTSTRYKKAEPQMALDLLYGYVTVDSTVNYGGGVEWHGNPFYSAVSTVPAVGSITYSDEEEKTLKEKEEEEEEEELFSEPLSEASIIVRDVSEDFSPEGPGYDYKEADIILITETEEFLDKEISGAETRAASLRDTIEEIEAPKEEVSEEDVPETSVSEAPDIIEAPKDISLGPGA